MHNIHNIAILPKQQVINCIARFSQEFNIQPFNFSLFLKKLKRAFFDLQFMNGQNNALWMSKRGKDFLANPKLFAVAPLTYICVFLSELFNRYKIDELEKNISQNVLQHALLRLNDFKLHYQS